MPHFRMMTVHIVREKWYPRRLIAVASDAPAHAPSRRRKPPRPPGPAPYASMRAGQDGGPNHPRPYPIQNRVSGENRQ
ncbi:hypothetical protein CNECB9_5300025 [Cupriavidus necator]|uniref:Uncharacterized protein n=1 Tax=Cupriavidus necator TaxID=106590 RepID=A0A1K0IPT6_CUPNE|nr:hypothetical protein CNECB9_5300025 [Cupriavidus necator]